MARPPLSTDDQARELAATLVRLARDDRPSRAAYHRVLRSVGRAGVAGGFLAGSSAGASVAVSSKSGISALALSIAKWTAVGALGSALAVAAPKVVTHVPMLEARGFSRDAPAPRRHTVAEMPHDIPREARPAPPSPLTDAPITEPAPVQAPRPPAPVRTDPLAPSRASRTAPDVLLSEVAELDKARTLLASRSPERALAVLEAYAERYPNGSLRLEATALRIEALAKIGRSGPAATLAKQFLAAHAHTPLAYRVREILDNLGSSKE